MSTSIEFDYKLYWYSHQLHDKMVWETIFQISNTVPVFILRIISCTLSIEFDSEQPVSVLTSYLQETQSIDSKLVSVLTTTYSSQTPEATSQVEGPRDTFNQISIMYIPCTISYDTTSYYRISIHTAVVSHDL